MVDGVAIVGCGLIGQKRARALAGRRLVAVADVDPRRAEALAAQHPGCVVAATTGAAIARADVGIVIVATTNDALAPIATAAVNLGKHVLLEKPGARSAAELRPLVDAARRGRATVKVGFNHRFHPAFQQARAIFDRGDLGPLMYIRARYGHGGRLGYEREWRADSAIAGGGEMLDQGVHLIDLSRWFAGDFTRVTGLVATFFWKMSVEDNGFACLQTASGQVAWLHASCTEWKNLFCFEIFGRDGKLQIDGLGGSYGVERLTWYKMLPQMGPPETTTWEYPGEDRSWHAEFEDLLGAIEHHRAPGGTVEDAIAALEVVEQLYSQSKAPDDHQS